MEPALMREIDVQAVIDRQPLGRPHFVLLALCTFVMFIDAFDIFMVGQIAPAIAKGMGEPPTHLTMVFLIQQIGLAIGAFTISPLSDRWGRKPLLIGCTLAFGALTLVSLAATSLLMLAILRGFAGLFLAAVIPNASALLTEFAPPRHRASFVTFSFVGYVAGSGAAALVTLFLLGQYGWRSCFVIGGTMPFVFALLFWRFGEESAQFRARRDATDASIGRTLARFEPDLADGSARFVVPATGPRAKGGIGDVFGGGRAGMTLLLWFSYFVGLGTISLLASWAATFFNVLAGVPLQTYAAASLFFLSGSLVGTLATGFVMDRLGPSRALVGLSIGAACALALLGSMPFGSPLSLFAFVMQGVCMTGAQAGLNALCAQAYPAEMRSTGIGWAFGMGRVGGILSPLLGGAAVAAALPIGQVYLAIATLPLLVAVALLFLARRLRAAAPTS